MAETLILIAWPLAGIALAVPVRRRFRGRGVGRAIAAGLAIIQFTTDFGAFAAEGYFRIRYGIFGERPCERKGRMLPFYVGDPYPYRNDPDRGWAHPPSSAGRFFGYDTSNRFRLNAVGVGCLDLFEEVRRFRKANPDTPFYFQEDRHPTPAGQRAIAQRIARFLLEEKLSP